MDDYNNKILKDSLDYKKAREERYKEVAHNELYQKSRKRIQTTMIGSLSKRLMLRCITLHSFIGVNAPFSVLSQSIATW